MGAILRDEPLCSSLSSALKLRGYCQHEVGAREIPRERVGRERDRKRQGKGQKQENKGQTDKKKKKNNKEKTESSLEVSQNQNKGDSVGRVK